MNLTTPQTASRGLVVLLAIAVGVIAANLYYAQPLVAMIAQALGLAPDKAGLVVTLTQIGYGLGVLLVVPLGDIVENRRLVLTMIFIAVSGLLGLAFSTQLLPYFVAAFATGLGSSTVQIIVPYAAHLSYEDRRGHVVGSLMSGLMIGIMLSRPVASLLADFFSWHAVFVVSAVLMTTLCFALYKLLPPRQPHSAHLHYTQLLASMSKLMLTTSVLRRRAIYQACLFGAFCLFWTSVPLLLAGEEFKMSQSGIALFALFGVAGAVSAPIAGRQADRGRTRIATTVTLIGASLSFLMGHIFKMGTWSSLIALGLSAILLDAGVSANLVLGQRAIFSLQPELRSRLNGLYIATIFIGGAAGSGLGAWAYAHGGWTLTSWIGFAMPTAALLYFATERSF